MRVSIYCHLFHGGRILDVDRTLDLADGATLLDAMGALVGEGGLPAPAAAPFRSGESSFALLVNGQRRDWCTARHEPLEDGAQISIVNPFAGG